MYRLAINQTTRVRISNYFLLRCIASEGTKAVSFYKVMSILEEQKTSLGYHRPNIKCE